MCLGQKAILSKDAVSLPIHVEIAFENQNLCETLKYWSFLSKKISYLWL